jgi:hypothetical protein
MTKQELIQFSWEKAGVKITPELKMDENGWIIYDVLPDGFIGENLDFLESEEDDDVFVMLTRPKKIRGIENNNGWKVINSEDDLPKSNYGQYHVFSKDPIFCKEPKNQSTDDYWLNDENKTKGWMKNYSHWQPIDKKQPPLHN